MTIQPFSATTTYPGDHFGFEPAGIEVLRRQGLLPVARIVGAHFGTSFIQTKTVMMDTLPNASSPEALPVPEYASTATAMRLNTELDAHVEALVAALNAFAFGVASEGELWDAFRKYLALTADEGLVAMAIRNVRTPLPVVALSTVLRMLGVDPSPSTSSGAKWFLVRALKDPHPSIRDGALAGLMNLDDSSAAAPIERAAAVERVQTLRSDMVDALSQWAE